MKAKLLIALLFFSCTANAADVEMVKKLIINSAKDPGSVVFRNVRVGTFAGSLGKFEVVCGEYNAKNSYGGYGGFTGFAYAYTKPDHLMVYQEAFYGSVGVPSIDYAQSSYALSQLKAYTAWCNF